MQYLTLLCLISLSFAQNRYGKLFLPSETASTILVLDAQKQVKSASGTGFVKATSGVYSTSSTVNVGSEVTGVLPVANGGTGASSLTSNNVILGNGTSAVNFVAPGSNGNVLTSNGTTWISSAPSGTANLNVTTETTTYNATTANDLILANPSGGAFTINLPAASGNTGKVLRFKKISSDFNAVTIDGNASETIDGATTTTLNTNNETLTIVCDGTNWTITDRKTDSSWTSYTPTFTGFGTATSIEFVWRRVGQNLEIRGKFTAGTATATEARISFPSGLTSAGTSIIPSLSISGVLISNRQNTTQLSSLIEPSVTYLTFGVRDASNSATAKANGNTIAPGADVFSVFASVPINGWNP